MTRKRYTKLLYALMQEINKGHIKWCGYPAKDFGKVLKAVQKAKPTMPYAEAWECLKDLRKSCGM